MSKAVAFFPWLSAPHEIKTIGPIRLFPFNKREGLPGNQSSATQEDIDAVIGAYADRPNSRLQSATLIEVDQWHLGDDPESAVERLFRAREALGFGALSRRKLFRGHFNYCCFDHFGLVVQRYAAGQGERFSFNTRRRDGNAGHLWTSEDFAFHRPLHATRLHQIDFDERLVELLMDDVPIHWLEAVAEFNRANTDSQEVMPHIEMVMMKSAFEWLLEIDQHASSFDAALGKLLADLPPRVTAKGPLESRWRSARPNATRPLTAWAREFCARRGAAAHGGIRGSGDWVWGEHSHLAFSSILFPLLLKKVAANLGRYEMSWGDQERLRRADQFVLFDPLGPVETERDGGVGRHPWVEIEDDVAMSAISHELFENLSAAISCPD